MDGPPPPPPPHGENPHTTEGEYRKASDLPTGNYDIFVVPPHSAGSGFLYLPSLQTNRNSFFAGAASTMLLVIVWSLISPAAKTWYIAAVSSNGTGNSTMAMIVVAFGVGIAGWLVGLSQSNMEGFFGGKGGGFSGGSGPGAGGPNANSQSNANQGNGQQQYNGGSGQQRQQHGGNYGGPKPGNQYAGNQNQSNADPPPNPEEEKEREKEQERQKEREREERERQKEKEKEEKERERQRAEKEREREETKRKEELRRKMDEFKRKREQEAKEKQRAAEREAMEKELKERREQLEREMAAAKAAAEKEARERLEKEVAEARAMHEKEAAEAKAEAERLTAEAKATSDRLAREAKEKAAKEAAEKEAAAKAAAQKEAMAKFAALKEAAAKRYAEKKAQEAKEKAANNKPAAPASATSAPRTPSPKKQPPFPTARTTVEEEDDAYSFRPYDRPRRPYGGASGSSAYSESSYAPSQSTARTTPPPSTRSAYSTKDPDKIVIQGVYQFNNAFMKTPVSQLVSGQGMVTDGLVLRITTEGLFVDDDLRGVGQREWDVKAWTLKLTEVWCPQMGAPPAKPGSSNPFSFRRGGGAHTVPTNEESDAFLTNLLKVCKNTCRLASPSACFARSANASGINEARAPQSEFHGLHVLRASIRDQEGKRYVFVLQDTEAWKVAIGLQRLRAGALVRNLGVTALSMPDCKSLLGGLGYV
ncbi:hypothetical protein N7486_004656 [Penicillium sp. IBT 16267x]|nr:hypothetical protein N7486_004656 [Penicillium sp. IBT 16267x]